MVGVKARVYLVRHGETDANKQGIIQGHLNTLLNDVGMKQAELVGDALKQIDFDEAYTSDLSRAKHTANAILKYHPEVHLVEDEELRERFMGELQGQSFWPGSKISATNSTSEVSKDFSRRTILWWNRKVLDRVTQMKVREEPYHILVTTHGGVIGTLVQNLVQSRKASCKKGVVISKCANASITVIELEEGSRKGVITQYADVSHLEGNALEFNADEIDINTTQP
ncbi:phosphoglycerate mutase-like protein [Cyathus striatus]|nr:phosphoglycerate mutase-like protein [Cyathus striatus]